MGEMVEQPIQAYETMTLLCYECVLIFHHLVDLAFVNFDFRSTTTSPLFAAAQAEWGVTCV